MKPYRIRKLLALQQKYGNEKPLVGLLSVFKLYFPNVVSLVIPSRKATFFRHPDRTWATTIESVISASNSANTSSQDENRNMLNTPLHSSTRGIKPRKTTVVPQLTTMSVGTSSVTLEQMGSFEDLLEHIDDLELPSQLASVLESRYLQHVLLCRSTPSTIFRLAHWLEQTLLEEFMRGDTSCNYSYKKHILDCVIKLSDITQETIPVCETFLKMYLKTWDGIDFLPEVLKLLARIRPCEFETLYGTVIKPLNKLYVTSSPGDKSKILLCYADMLRNFASYNWTDHYTQRLSGKEEESKDFSYIFGKLDNNVDYMATIQTFVETIDHLCVLGLEADGDNALVQHGVLSFFEVVCRLHTRFHLPFVAIPSMSIVYRCFLSSHAMSVSRIASIISMYKAEFSSLKPVTQNDISEKFQLNSMEISFPNGLEKIDTFNSYIMDFCNTLWRHKVLPDPSSKVHRYLAVEQ